MITACHCGAFRLLTSTGVRYEQNSGAICLHKAETCRWYAELPTVVAAGSRPALSTPRRRGDQVTRAERIEAAAVALLEVADEWAGTRSQLRELRAALSTPADASDAMAQERKALVDLVPILTKLEDGACESYPYESCCRSCERLGANALEIALDGLSPYPGKDRWSEPASAADAPTPPPRPDEDGGRCGDRNRLAEGPCILPRGHSDWHSDGLGSGWDDESTGRAPKAKEGSDG